MKKVLVITYYWPPSGGAGVQRWLKFVKYLRSFGWEPIVFTAEGGEVPVVDHSLKKDVPDNLEVIYQKIWEPYGFYKKLIGQKKEDKIQTGFLSENEKPKKLENLSVWIRGNFFIPDARKFWIRPSVKILSKYLKENKVDAIASNGPPHTTHMIGLALKRKFGLPWLADFRDPWTNIDFYDKLRLTDWADKKHHRLEAEVIKNADKLVTVSPSWAQDFKKIADVDFEVIYNGFDSDDFEIESIQMDTSFTIAHIGSMNADRNPESLWKALGELCLKDEGFKKSLEIKLIGSTDVTVKNSISENGLMENVNKMNYMPHAEVVKQLASSQVLLLPINDTPNSMGVIPGKLFEYLASKRPILVIGPLDGDSCKLIRDNKAGYAFDFSDQDGIKGRVQQMYVDFQGGSLEVTGNELDKFTRKNLTKELADLLNEIA